jgi:hypothetical protein
VKQPGEDKRLTDYLLGNLPESEEIRLEEEYLADPDAQERLAAAEDDLVDSYHRGGLSAQERKQLETRFLASPRGRRDLALAKSLTALASQQRPAAEPRPLPFFRLRWALTAAALLLILAVGWWMKERMLPPGPKQAEIQPGNTNGQTGGAVAHPTNTPPPTASPEENALIASIILRPAARNAGPSAILNIPFGTRTVKIRLALEVDNHKSYKATLLGAGDEPKWSGHHLKAESGASGRAIVLSLPAALLETGEYTILLAADEDQAGPLAEYIFIVLK